MPAIMPPSTTSSAPVVNDDASLARNATVAATSAAVPPCPSGMSSTSRSSRDAETAEDAAVTELIGERRTLDLQHVGDHDPLAVCMKRANTLGPDAARRRSRWRQEARLQDPTYS